MMINSYNALSVPQPVSFQPALQTQTPIAQNNFIYYIPQLCVSSPPMFHTNGDLFAFTCVDQMTVEQTANWIWTFGAHKGWAEAAGYAESFKANDMTGELLRNLTPELLECDMGITKLGHRMEILSQIKYLYPNLTVGNSGTAPTAPSGTLQSQCESTYKSMKRPRESDCGSTVSYLVSACPSDIGLPTPMSCSDKMSESSYSERSTDVVMSDRLEDAMSGRQPRQLRCRKLLITLQPDQIHQDGCPIKRILSRFEELNISVEDVLSSDDKPNTYIVVFQNITEAQEALSKADEIGYRLTKKWPKRPNPKRPIQYKSLKALIIRSGKAFSGKEVGTLEKGKIVTVNQIKGRRARLIEEKNGETVNLGWVSVHEANGTPLLTPLNEDC